jgi:hypothetical protein
VRDDGGSPDLGYPKVVALGHASVLAVYYFNEGGAEERYIAASLVPLA